MGSVVTDRKQGTTGSPDQKVNCGKQIGEDAPKKVFICSPFRPSGRSREEREKDLKKNIALAKEACRYAIGKGFIPYAPHLYFPGFLSDSEPDERELGILLGLTWLARCDEVWIAGLRISEGMRREIDRAMEWEIPVRSYLPIPGRKGRLFDVEFYTEDEFLRRIGWEK